MTDLVTAFKRIDEHAQKINEHAIKLAVHDGDIKTIQRDMHHICKTLQETRTEVVTRQDSIVKTLETMQKESFRSEGRMEAVSKIPIIMTTIAVILQIWIVLRK